MYFTKTPKIIHSIFPEAYWNFPNDSNKIYLTFDDGPTESITENTLDILKSFQVAATFFCLGKQVEKNPSIFNRIQKEGHAIGNHSYAHLKGWITNNETYLNDVQKAQQLINSPLFRPPYGKIKRSQLAVLKKSFKIIMWDVLPGDFSPKNSVKDIIENTTNNVESGSIIVLHDNDKCGIKMNTALPQIITSLKEKGFIFETIQG